MKKLIVDADGKITIPPNVLEKRGLRPGDELSLVEVAEGLLVYQSGLDAKTGRWWNSLSEEERQQAHSEALRYERRGTRPTVGRGLRINRDGFGR